MFQNRPLGLYDKLTGGDLVWNVLAWTFMLFFVPMLCLGTISPQVMLAIAISSSGWGLRTARSRFTRTRPRIWWWICRDILPLNRVTADWA